MVVEEEIRDSNVTRADGHRLCLQVNLGWFQMGFPLEMILGQD